MNNTVQFMRKKLIPFATAFIATTMILSACGQSSSQSTVAKPYQKEEKVVELQFWTSGVEQINQELADQFNETKGKELNIHVNAEYQGDYREMQKKVNASSIANTLPNVFIDEVAMTHGFTENDVILNLEPYIQANNFNRDDFKIGDLGNLYVGKDMYAFPHMRSVPVMYVNKNLTKSIGLDEKGPQTFTELEQYLQASYDKTGKTPMYLFNYDFWVMEALLYSFSETSVLNKEETASNINSEGAVKLITYLNDLISKDLIKVLSPTQQNEFVAAVSSPDTLLTFSSIGGYRAFLGIAEKSGTELGVAMIPAGEKGTRGVSVGGSNVYMANTGTDNEKAASFEFMKWLTDTEQAAFASTSTGYLPTRVTSLETDMMKKVVADLPGYQVAMDELGFGKMRATTGAYSEIENLLVSKINDIWTDKLNVQESLDALKKEVDAILAR